jgi:hypothetical protein
MIKELQDSSFNRYILNIQQKRANLWRITLQKLGKFNNMTNVGSLDIVKENDTPKHEVWLNYIDLDSTDVENEANEFLWNAAKDLAKENNWTKFYGELTLEQIENRPKIISWLKKRSFTIRSEIVEENIHFFCLLAV